MLGHKLKQLTESMGPQKVTEFLTEAIKTGKVQKHQISLRNLAESFMGHNWAQQWGRHQANLLEATEAVDASAFSNITGQLLINEVKERYQAADFVGDQLTTKIPITNGNLKEQKTPWLGGIVDAPSALTQGQPYPRTTFPEQWIVYPAPGKFGEICAVTFEMIFSDLTTQVFEAAGAVGERLGVDREERILRVVLGLVNSHIWNDTAFNTYLTSGSWINKITGQTLRDWTTLNSIEQLFVNMKDPVTGKVIKVKPDGMLVMPGNYYNAKRVVNATETRQNVPGYATSANPTQTVAPNPLEVNYPLLKSPYAYQLLLDSGVSAANAVEYVFLGQFKKAFVYREVYPLQTEQAPPQNPWNFEQDIVLSVRAREFGVPGVKDPRYVALAINA